MIFFRTKQFVNSVRDSLRRRVNQGPFLSFSSLPWLKLLKLKYYKLLAEDSLDSDGDEGLYLAVCYEA